MRKTFLTALATATILSGAMLAGRAETATAPTVSAVGATHPATPLLREAAIVCGGNGCNSVPTKAKNRRKFYPLGYTKPI
jgi:hypothetical protein